MAAMLEQHTRIMDGEWCTCNRINTARHRVITLYSVYIYVLGLDTYIHIYIERQRHTGTEYNY